jgi:peptide/nickel transport system ATP-binding protein
MSEPATLLPLLDVRNMRIETGTGMPIIHGLSFTVARGEFLAIVGESGSGKTMAARALLRLLPSGLVQTGGAVHLEGKDITALPEEQFQPLRGLGMGMVFQEPMVSLNPAMTVGAQMAEGLALHLKLSAAEIRERSIAMLERVGIGDAKRCLGAYPHEFSGGMRQRIMLASVMLLKPKLLIADEPTTALDTLTQAEVLDLMVELARDNGTAIILITHNLGLVARYTQRALVLEKGHLVESGTTRALLNAPREDYTRALIAALPRRAETPPAQRTGEAVVSVRNLSVTHAGALSLFRRRMPKKAVDDVSLEIYPREVVAVVGGSGSGKTTLGRALLRLIPASSGEVHFDGQDILKAPRAAQRAFTLAAQLVFQDPYSSLDPRMSVGAIIAEPLRHVPGLSASGHGRIVDAVLDDVGLSGFGPRLPHQLSGGQRQRAAIARALVRRPRFIVADEPVSALDMTIQAQILGLFRTLQAEYGFACLFISHDLAAIEQIADRVVVMRDGRIIEEAARDDLFDNPREDYTRALLAAAPRIDWQPASTERAAP